MPGNGTMSDGRSVFRDETGVTAMEYGLVAALVALALVTILGSVGGKLKTVFTNVSAAL